VVLDHEDARCGLGVAMGARWRVDLEGDGADATRIDELVDASVQRLAAAPAALLGCLTWDGLDRYPDETRRRAEHGMALLSLGAAVENLMLAATDRGYASCWVAAPIFCPEAARDALALPTDWLPHALVLVGRPDPAYVGRERPPIPLDELRVHR
jgi:F420 biosynthesis protein FbiB-like protein